MAESTKAALITQLFQSHSSGLLRYIKYKLGRADIAEDIAQNAFVRIQQMQNPERLENIQAYLYKTATNLVIDHSRHEQHRHNYQQQELHRSEDNSAPECPERHLNAQRQIDAILVALTHLPNNCQRAFLLHRIHGKSYSAIAKELSVSVSSVEKYICRAFLACRAIQENDDNTANREQRRSD